MILLSKLIKSFTVLPAEKDEKIIEVKSLIKQLQQNDLLAAGASDTGIAENRLSDAEAVEKANELFERENLLLEKEASFEMWRQEQEGYIQNQAEDRFREGAEQGFNQGYQDGVNEAQKQVDGFLAQAEEIVSLSRTDYQQKIEDAESTILELGLQIAEKIVGTSLAADNNTWISLVKQALNEVREQEVVKIYVHPFWYETTLKQQAELMEAAMHATELTIYPDGKLPENGCIIDTPFGKVEATLDVQLSEMKRILSERLKEQDTHES